jgi:hypothetical protein
MIRGENNKNGRKKVLITKSKSTCLDSKHQKNPVFVDHKWHWWTKIQTGYRLPTQDDQVVH